MNRSLLLHSFSISLSVFLAGCFTAPKPNCAFVCQTSPECPADYTCVATDHRCHLMVNGSPAMCPDTLPIPDGSVDAPVDAGMSMPDAPKGPDANLQPDANVPTTTHTGSISVQDISIQNDPELGHGLQVSVSLTPLDTVAPVYDDTGGGLTGCTVHVYDLGAGQIPPITSDEGAISITGAASVQIPPCTFVSAAVGYACIDVGSSGAGMIGIVVGGPVPAGAAAVQMVGSTFDANDVGRYLTITGGAANNDGSFPIVAVTAADTVLIGNPVASSQAPFSGTYTTIAGVGPAPAPMVPTLSDSDTLHVSITPGGGNDFSFPMSNVTVGDSFTLDSTSANAITNVPLDGSAMTLACATGSCGSSLGTVVVMTTTDNVIPTGAPAYYMPAPASKVAVLQCAQIGATSIAIPAAAMAAIMSANPSRIRTTYFRDDFAPVQNPDSTNPVKIIAGHAVVGFTTNSLFCNVPADCGANTDCLTRTCTAHACGGTFTLSGTATSAQTAGDCHQNVCDGMGGVMPVIDNADIPVDGNDCTNDVCTAGSPSNPALVVDTTCSAGFCNGFGACVECNHATQCPASTNPDCSTATCSLSACGFSFATSGTTTSSQTAGDCHTNQCDGAGNTVNVVDNSDVPIDANQCTDNVCTAGVPSNPNSSIDAPCGAGQFCDGAGTCVQCNSGSECMSMVCASHVCQAPSCSDGVKNGLETAVDCGGGTCGPCASGLACGVNSDCISGLCTGMICQATCTDGVKNQGESDIDCGGPCTGCPTGDSCVANSDCISLDCGGTTCLAPTCSDGIKNEGESDTDCGGPTCGSTCVTGKMCNFKTDCVSLSCTGGFCD
jgi:hypothetical protein